MEHMYLCIDLKSFYASVECVERGLDPLKTNLAVADPDRGDKTVCLAITPPMKALGIKNRCRVFQIPKDISYIKAPPRMKLYIAYSAKIYGIYLKYIAREDIHVYSIDEAFLDVTHYLSLYQTDARMLAVTILKDVKETTGITAAAGIGTNLYLAKIALDLTAKKAADNIGYLDEKLYRQKYWRHRPLTDFWRIGSGIQGRLARAGIFTMEDIAHADENLLYKMLGIDAELLIDHAWGRETATIEDIKAYKPKNNSVSSGQVLPRNYSYEEGELILKEMVDDLCLTLVERSQAASGAALTVCYDARTQQPDASGSVTFRAASNSYQTILPQVLNLYQSVVQKNYPIRKIAISFHRLSVAGFEQLDLFTAPEKLEKERRLQSAILKLKKKFGKNAVVRGRDLFRGATAMERNRQIGGHKSGE